MKKVSHDSDHDKSHSASKKHAHGKDTHSHESESVHAHGSISHAHVVKRADHVADHSNNHSVERAHPHGKDTHTHTEDEEEEEHGHAHGPGGHSHGKPKKAAHGHGHGHGSHGHGHGQSKGEYYKIAQKKEWTKKEIELSNAQFECQDGVKAYLAASKQNRAAFYEKIAPHKQTAVAIQRGTYWTMESKRARYAACDKWLTSGD